MLTIKVPLRKAENLKNYLLDNCFFNKEYEISKDKNFIYFPINEKKNLKKKFPFIEFVSKELKGTHKLTIRDLLKDKLTKKELNLVPSAFDVIGGIIILEIKQGIVKKEKIIAEAFLKLNKNIKTVAKKEGIHKGVYRVQKLKILAGISKKETIYKENNVKIKLDVENVYFSPRLSSERKRIMTLVKPKESILVMFSGCGPYPLVLSKNTKAKEVYGVEINPIAHKYALENLKLNKLNNISFYCGDVKEILPKMGFDKFALKSRWDKKHLESKVKQNPFMIEFYTPKGDIESDKTVKKIDQSIKKLAKKQIKIMIHMPLAYKDEKDISLAQHPDRISNTVECMKKINRLNKNNENVIGYVFHPTHNHNKSDKYKEEWLLQNLSTLEKEGLLNSLYLENCINPVFGTKKSILNIIKKSNLKHICFDFAHFMIVNKNLTVKDYKDITSKIDVYNHINNQKPNSEEHSCGLREGNLDFREFAEYINKGCVEVFSKSEITAKEQIQDWKYFLSIKPRKKFERVLMPLPKSAGDFLDLALNSIKPNGMIHFYDFLKENEFEKAREKIIKACKKAGKKAKILRIVKCGQHAPRVFRICVDFKVY
ncbi:hypothetical protein AUJ83_02650 [Candidatus Woesearchaeota archaeon CG1_02_33_12]|nr:MAG: hypothetical protein AUJ83_02650 [Candidatus Woesearchaeota archaeon CG1_02_33_12]PIN79291.1 MAG: hypothetical protein COV14_00140 [Candidatus Woesearchaeota archaeon CG10_big_fil_rev_8_21_14_0_10_33_12]PIU72702.1 MAG: hypothetical protein COS79_01535 [Candidatus Woesearchaeota archaeon CG06_land_8_20_14_3_00_33_13]